MAQRKSTANARPGTSTPSERASSAQFPVSSGIPLESLFDDDFYFDEVAIDVPPAPSIVEPKPAPSRNTSVATRKRPVSLMRNRPSPTLESPDYVIARRASLKPSTLVDVYSFFPPQHTASKDNGGAKSKSATAAPFFTKRPAEPPAIATKKTAPAAKKRKLSSLSDDDEPDNCLSSNRVMLDLRPTKTADCFSGDKDVLLIFAKESVGGKQILLWSTRSMLQEASPYWQMLFESGYKEGEEKLEGLHKWKEMLANDVQRILDENKAASSASLGTLCDSDAEDDDGTEVGSSKGKGKAVARQSEDGAAIRYIVVNDASSRTYRAVLHWIETKRISLSTLTSLVPSQIVRQTTSASPKSVYALAHKLGLTTLQKIALEHFSDQLYSHNVLKELFSMHAALYPEIAEAAMNAAVEHMPAIKASGGHSYINEVMNAGSLDGEYVARAVTELVGRMCRASKVQQKGVRTGKH